MRISFLKFFQRPVSDASPKSGKSLHELPTQHTVLDKNINLYGELSSRGNILIEGSIEGSIQCAKGVEISETGNVRAEIQAESILIHGSVHGDCKAIGKIEIATTGEVVGDVSANAISVTEGAIFRGIKKLRP